MKKPNLNTIIADNLNKTAHVPNKGMSGLPNKKATVPFVSNEGYKNGLPPVGSHYRIPSDTLYNPTPYRIKATPNNGPSKWLEAYDTSNTQFPGADYVDEQHYDMGGYISDKAKATQFGQYAEGGSSWMLTNPNRIATYFPRMANGGGLDQYQTKGEVTYTHEPGKEGSYRLQRTVSPFLSNRDIRRYTQTPTSPRQVNFVQNYAGAIGSQDNPEFNYPTQVPIEGKKHWNIDRFIIDPQFSNRNLPNQESLQQNRANTLADMYKYYMLQDPEHKRKAFRQAKRFVRREIDPRIKGPFIQSYNTVGIGNPDYFQQGYQGTENFANQNAIKDLYFREAVGSGNVTPEEIEKLKDVSMDYFRNYKKMSRRESKYQWNKWNQEATTAKETNVYSLGGGLLSKTVTCSNCGWSWKAVDGGKDVMTCHKCGGTIKMKNGGDISIPDLQEDNWLKAYGPGGQTTDGCPPGYSKHPILGTCIPNGWTASVKQELGPTVANAKSLNEKIVAQQRANGNYIKPGKQGQQATLGVDRSNEPWRQRQVADIKKYEAMKKSELAQTMGSFTPSGSNVDAGVIGAENFVNMNPITGPAASTGRITQAALGQNPYGFDNSGISWNNALAGLGVLGDATFAYAGLKPVKVSKPTSTQRITRGPINYWEEPNFAARNPKFNPNSYANSVNKFGNTSGNIQPEMMPRLSSSYPPTPKQSSLFAFGNSEMFTNPKQYFTKPSAGATFTPNYENIKKAASQGRDPFAETLSLGTYTPAPRVLDWKKIGKTAVGFGIGSGLVSGGLRQKKEGGVTSPQICYDPKTGKVVPCKPGAHKTWIFTENPAITAPEDELPGGLTRENAIKDNAFTKEAEDLKNYLIKNQPGEDIEIYPTYKSDKNDRVTTTNRGKTLNEILRGSDAKTRLAFMAHHGSNLFGSPAGNLGKKLQATTYDNCYLGSCYSGDIAASDEFKGLSNFNFRPGYGNIYNSPDGKEGLSWFGVNPNKNSQTGEAGVNNAFFNTTNDIDALNNLYKQERSVEDKIHDLYRKNDNSEIYLNDKRNPFYKDYESLSAQIDNLRIKEGSAQKKFVGNPKKGREYDILNPTNGPHIGTGTRWNTLFLSDNEFDDTPMNNTQNRFRYEDGGSLPKAQDGWVQRAANAEFSCAANPRSNLNQSYSEYCNPKKGLDNDEYKALKKELASGSMKDLLNVEEYYVLKNLADNQNRKMGREDNAYSKYFDQSTGLPIPNLTNELKEEGNLRATNRMYPGRKNLLVNDVYQGILKDYNITTPQTPAQTKALLEKAYNIGYSIPKQQDGGFLPKAQIGEIVRAPIYTDDFQKVRNYKDSLSLYNKGVGDEKFLREHGMTNAITHEFPFSRVTSYGYANKPKGKIQPTSAVSQTTDPSHPNYYRAEWLKYKKPVELVVYKKPEPTLKDRADNLRKIISNRKNFDGQGLKPQYQKEYDSYWGELKNKKNELVNYEDIPTGNKKHLSIPIYKQKNPSVQPVVLQKEPSLKKKVTKAELLKSDRTAFTPGLVGQQRPDIQLPTIQNLPYRVEYYDGDTNRMTHKYFIDDKAGSEFIKELLNRSYGIPYGVQAYYEIEKLNTPKKENGGWLEKFDEGGGSLPKAQNGFGCTGKSKCITGSDQKKKDGISGGYIGGTDNIVPPSNAPINYDELTKYIDDQYTDRSSKKQRQAEYAQAAQLYPGLTKNDFYASQGEASRLNSRINDIPTWDKPENQTYDRAWYPYYRSIIQPGVKVNSSQILKFISEQPGGLGGYRQTVESNYGLKKNRYGGWLNQYQGGGEEPLTKSSADWYKQWYEQRKTLPQFSRVAGERLNLLSTLPKVQLTPLEELHKSGAVAQYQKTPGDDASQDIISLADPATVPAFAKKIGKSVDVNIGTDPSVVGHEMSHWFDARANQSIFKPRGISKSEPYQKYPFIKPSSLKNSNLGLQTYKWITSEDASQFGPGIKTEVNSVLNELRKKEGFRGDQPTTPEQLQKIIDKYMNLPESDLDGGTPNGSQNQLIRTLIKYMGEDPKKLSELNNRIVAIQKEDVPIAKHGGWLSQYADEGMEVTTQTTNPSYGKAFEYIVKAGDNLSKISRNTGLSVKQISQANNIFDPNKIRINQKLMLPAVGGNQPAQSYQKWEDIKARQDAMNNLQDNADYSGNEQRISQYYLNRPEESYVVVDKQRGRMNYYKGNKLIKSYEVGVGENLGDAQTVTKVNPKTGKTDWNAGNKSTGAGVYSISNINPASKEYYGLPSFNMKNDQGIEVATSIHGTPASRRVRFGNNNVQDNRMSNGCINGRCEDLPDMFKRFDIGNKVYVLPEDQGNRFQIVDGKPVLRVPSANRAKYNKYVDRTGTSQKGQGVNQTVKTLQYKPTIGYLDKKLFKNDVYQWNDFNDEKEFNKTTKPYFSALVNNKKKIMEATNIPSDIYNEIAKMSFGIYGTESNFGDTHSSVGNFARAIAKLTNSSSSSSPDYKSKATTYGADSDNNSVGLTQIRWSQLNNDEKGALKKLGITSNKDFLDPEKSAIATTAILALRYSQQLTEDQKKDIWKYLPTKWNSRGNYANRVKNNSKYLTFKQLDDNLKMGGETNGWLTKHL